MTRKTNYTVWAHGDGDTLVTDQAALLFGIFCNTQLTGATVVKNGSNASGEAVVTLPSGMTVGTFYELPGVKMNEGIFVDDGSSAGEVILFWRLE